MEFFLSPLFKIISISPIFDFLLDPFFFIMIASFGILIKVYISNSYKIQLYNFKLDKDIIYFENKSELSAFCMLKINKINETFDHVSSNFHLEFTDTEDLFDLVSERTEISIEIKQSGSQIDMVMGIFISKRNKKKPKIEIQKEYKKIQEYFSSIYPNLQFSRIKEELLLNNFHEIIGGNVLDFTFNKNNLLLLNNSGESLLQCFSLNPVKKNHNPLPIFLEVIEELISFNSNFTFVICFRKKLSFSSKNSFTIPKKRQFKKKQWKISYSLVIRSNSIEDQENTSKLLNLKLNEINKESKIIRSNPIHGKSLLKVIGDIITRGCLRKNNINNNELHDYFPILFQFKRIHSV
ncbi:MAG: hypothetical protein ACTSUV_05795 [Candidatus Ranarchaeia archaeon]